MFGKSLQVGLGLLRVLLPMMATVIAPAATADDIALAPLMAAGIALVVVFADLQLWEHLPRPIV